MSIILNWNLGLGDSIICNGLVRTLAERGGQLVLPVWHHNHDSVQAMFSDLSNVKMLPVKSELSYPGAMDIGLSNPEFGRRGTFDQEFYRLAGLDFDLRWSAFHLPEAAVETQIAPPAEPYILVHHRPDINCPVRVITMPDGIARVVYVTPRTTRITDWVKMIANAEEIHCIDSSFIHLVESVPSKGRLVFHNYARPSNFQRRKDWEVLV